MPEKHCFANYKDGKSQDQILQLNCMNFKSKQVLNNPEVTT